MSTWLQWLVYADIFADDVLIAIAWALALSNSVITHKCKTLVHMTTLECSNA